MMRPRALARLALTMMMAPVGLPSQAASPAVPAGLGASLIDGYIAPATRRFEQAGRAMATALQAYCTASTVRDKHADTVSRAELDRAFEALAVAWAGVEFLRFGPLVEDNRFERVFFWPDPRGAVSRRTQAVLAAQDQALLQAGALRAGSVAIQGLPSLEYALFGGDGALLAPASEAVARPASTSTATRASTAIATSATTPEQAPAPYTPASAYRCAYATAVALNVAGLAGEIAQAWGPAGQMAQDFRSPGPQNALYRNPAEVAAEAVKAMSSGLHFIRDAKLLPAMGSSPEKARPNNAPLRRSGDTLAVVEAGLRGIGAFYRAAGLSTVMTPNDAWLASVVTSGTEHLAGQLAGLDMPLDEALAQPAARERLGAVIVGMNDLKDMIDGQVAQALGVNVGFNALDGD